jgi:hypothetical protein
MNPENEKELINSVKAMMTMLTTVSDNVKELLNHKETAAIQYEQINVNYNILITRLDTLEKVFTSNKFASKRETKSVTEEDVSKKDDESSSTNTTPSKTPEGKTRTKSTTINALTFFKEQIMHENIHGLKDKYVTQEMVTKALAAEQCKASTKKIDSPEYHKAIGTIIWKELSQTIKDAISKECKNHNASNKTPIDKPLLDEDNNIF